MVCNKSWTKISEDGCSTAHAFRALFIVVLCPASTTIRNFPVSHFPVRMLATDSRESGATILSPLLLLSYAFVGSRFQPFCKRQRSAMRMPQNSARCCMLTTNKYVLKNICYTLTRRNEWHGRFRGWMSERSGNSVEQTYRLRYSRVLILSILLGCLQIFIF